MIKEIFEKLGGQETRPEEDHLKLSEEDTKRVEEARVKGLRIYDQKTKKEIISKDFEENIDSPTFSPSGEEIIVGEGDKGLKKIKEEEKQEKRE